MCCRVARPQHRRIWLREVGVWRPGASSEVVLPASTALGGGLETPLRESAAPCLGGVGEQADRAVFQASQLRGPRGGGDGRGPGRVFVCPCVGSSPSRQPTPHSGAYLEALDSSVSVAMGCFGA